METLPAQFDEALTLIGLGDKRDRAINAHGEIQGILDASDELRALGLETLLIGSYGRKTVIYPGKDVDVFARLMKADATHDPGKLFKIVQQVLVDHYGQWAQPQNRSIKVEFPDEFAVDVVPAVPKDGHYGIPNRDPGLWDREDERWVLTDPVKLGELTVDRNRLPTVGGRGAYVPTVRMVRQIRKHHLAERRPGGFYFELMTYYALESGVEGGSFAEITAQVLRDIADQLASGKELLDPALGTPFAPAPEPADRTHAATVFAELATQAEEALELDLCPAAATWRRIFGDNDRGSCFPLPENCGEDGTALKVTTASASSASKKDSGFA